MAIKIDITKAFNTVSWDFLFKVLHCMNFSSLFVGMVSNILHSARLSVLINGSHYGYFSYSQGVCQGDPLPPLLFCMAEEALARWIEHQISTNMLLVYAQLPNYLFYADDVIVFLDVTSANCRNLH